MDFIAGIDGGGTKTSVVCHTLQGETVCRKTFGAFNLNSIGETRFRALLEEIMGFLATQGRCLALCAGAAGASNPRLRELTAAAMDRAGIARWKLAGDHEIALHGALAGEPGCLIIAGTGSICFGRNGRGETARAGGWGHLIGDGGSGYALGRDAVETVARQMDGLDSPTALTELFAGVLDLDSREAIVAYVYGGGKDRLAAIAPLVERAAAQGDAAARRILERNARELAGLVWAVAGRLGLEAGQTGLYGGLLEHDTALRGLFLDEVKTRLPRMRCIAARRSAADGAALMARELLD